MLILTSLLAACAPAPAQPSAPAPAVSATHEQALARVEAQRVERPGWTVPGTPPELNRSVTVRYRSPGRATPRAIAVLMPGFLGGAGSLDRLARQIVVLDPGVQVWAVDRRANLLEPQQTLQAAAGRTSAELQRLVREGIPPRAANELVYMSAWGLDVTLRDWRTAVLEARRLTPNVYLGGHSLGGVLTGLYAAYDFDGTPGYRDVRGLMMFDGVPGGTSGLPSVDERGYLEGFNTALGRSPGLNDLEQGRASPFVDVPVFSPLLASRAAAGALLAARDPNGISPGGLVPYPATNLAAALVQLDRHYAPLDAFAVTTGQAVGAQESLSLPAIVINGWNGKGLSVRSIEGPQAGVFAVGWQPDPQAPTDALDFVRRFWLPTGDYLEWYFPSRLILDITATPLSTRGSPLENRLKVWHTAQVNLPLLGVAAEDGITSEASYQTYAAQTRTRLETHTLEGYAHLDVVAARSDRLARWVVAFLR
ncbi:hypothetical protein HNR42_002343 [Deinobacterium chartae]|uniref:Alpha/beta hydrolase n=1 Tax=Deinobacterium chartae TaxID=521158 RepID=A0A841I3G0_9DEIO|nr:alpha/beta hydrolase [Deinobacterium chartae]MBB6098908.1 hypothetical protein [Deinobacterium chartae]